MTASAVLAANSNINAVSAELSDDEDDDLLSHGLSESSDSSSDSDLSSWLLSSSDADSSLLASDFDEADVDAAEDSSALEDDSSLDSLSDSSLESTGLSETRQYLFASVRTAS
ncbi:hypothetical protein PsorP6_001581 [Peronosclerospora sorghi]|uniref:Uncharacterized protein n=1 Tax=Peronosclerospora sorghi TaxID=230839 RepID=A0ACC0WPJ2_9STRA|nr:hypothetical protein PsorP6_001581 [Peronosclerospora sorghi]